MGMKTLAAHRPGFFVGRVVPPRRLRSPFLWSRGLHSASASAPTAASPLILKPAPLFPSPILQDKYGRTHTYLRMSLIEKCNLRCQYCMPEEGIDLTPTQQLLDADEIFKVAKMFVEAGVTKIRFTGGEPTVRPDIEEIIQRVNTLRHSGLQTIGITTNGIVLQRKLAGLRAAGLDTVNISLDTLDPHHFTFITRRNGHSKVMGAIEQSLELMPSGGVKVNVVVMRGLNHHEVVDFVRLTEERDMEVRFIEFMPFDGNKFSRNKFFSFGEMKEQIEAALPLERVVDSKSDVSKVFRVPGWKGRVGFITSMSEHFCGTCNRLRITADGNLKVCLFGATEVSLRDAMREGRSEDELRAIIGAAVQRKKPQHAGMDAIANSKNRPMITIGG